jgi:signal transduction histidine kinase/ligand-binding sensor domain-containing protein
LNASSTCLERIRTGLPRSLAVILAAVLAPAACALDPHRLLEEYIHDRWTDEQGYPGGAVSAFAQTPDGYLWLGAENGLVRFDGITFRIFNHANAEAFPSSGVLALATDDEGDLWVLMQSREVLRYRRGVFEPIAPEAGATAVAPGRRRDLLFVRPSDTMRYANGKFVQIAPASGYTSRLVISVAEAPDGTVWMGTRDHGVFALRDGRAFEPGGLPDQKVNCILADYTGVLWMGTDRGLAKWTGDEVTQSGLPALLRATQVSAILRDHDSNLWLGTANGLMRLTPQGALERDGSSERKAEPATALFEDREGNIWVGRRRGFERWHDRAFLSYETRAAADSENSGPVYADPSGRAWFGPSSGGLYWLKNAERGQITEAGLGHDVVYSMDGGPGELWIGRQRGGLTHLRYDGQSTASETFTVANGLASGPIYAVRRGADGTVWAGSLSGGVSRIRGGRIANFTTANGLASNTVSAIEEAADGTMWFATANGLSELANDRWKVYSSKEGLPPARINCLFEDSAGILWIGTDAGLAFLRNGRLQTPRDKAEPLLEEVLGIADDSLGGLWIATSKRVARIDRAQALEDAGETLPMREFGPADGIPSAEGVRRDRSVVKDSAGRIWFSLRHGISVMEPARLSLASVPAIAHIESVSADGGPLDASRPLRIPASRVRIRFEYLALSLSAPERIKYRYRLDNLDQGWSDPTSARDTVYMNLPPGAYRFRVIASDSGGMWSGAEADIGMEVTPAFSQTWAFRFLAIVACAIATLAIYRLRVRRLTKELNIGFQERLDERTRIAQELHDTLLQGLLATSMQLHVAVRRLGTDSPALPHLTRVVTMLQEVVNESRDAVRGLRAPASGSDDLEEAFSRVREELAVPESTGFRIVVDGPRRPLSPLIRDQVYRIGRESISNAFRHSGADMVEVEIDYGGSHLRLAVRDTGRGIDEKVLRSGREGHWGLIGMRESAEKIGAHLKVSSRAGEGTEMELTVPGHIAFFKPPSERLPRWSGWRFWRRLKTRAQVAKSAGDC